MAEQELKQQLVSMVSNLLSNETKEIKDLVLHLLSIIMQKSKNTQVEVTAKNALETYFKKNIQLGLLDIDNDFDIESIGANYGI